MIAVVAGVLLDEQNNILIALRPQHVPQGGLWEFPGGKVQAGETSEVALARELREELGVEIVNTRYLMDVTHHYSDKTIRLEVHWIDTFQGTPHGREGQTVQWVHPAALSDFTFPDANYLIVQRIQEVLTASEDTNR